MEKLSEAVTGMAKLELQLTKDIDAIRHRMLTSSQGDVRDDVVTVTGGCEGSTLAIPQRIEALREARRRLTAGGSCSGQQGESTGTGVDRNNTSLSQSETEDF